MRPLALKCTKDHFVVGIAGMSKRRKRYAERMSPVSCRIPSQVGQTDAGQMVTKQSAVTCFKVSFPSIYKQLRRELKAHNLLEIDLRA